MWSGGEPTAPSPSAAVITDPRRGRQEEQAPDRLRTAVLGRRRRGRGCPVAGTGRTGLRRSNQRPQDRRHPGGQAPHPRSASPAWSWWVTVFGMLTAARIREDLAPVEGLRWITSLRAHRSSESSSPTGPCGGLEASSTSATSPKSPATTSPANGGIVSRNGPTSPSPPSADRLATRLRRTPRRHRKTLLANLADRTRHRVAPQAAPPRQGRHRHPRRSSRSSTELQGRQALRPPDHRGLLLQPSNAATSRSPPKNNSRRHLHHPLQCRARAPRRRSHRPRLQDLSSGSNAGLPLPQIEPRPQGPAPAETPDDRTRVRAHILLCVLAYLRRVEHAQGSRPAPVPTSTIPRPPSDSGTPLCRTRPTLTRRPQQGRPKTHPRRPPRPQLPVPAHRTREPSRHAVPAGGRRSKRVPGTHGAIGSTRSRAYIRSETVERTPVAGSLLL